MANSLEPEVATVRSLRYWQAEREALLQEMRANPKIILLGEDIAGGARGDNRGVIEGWGGAYGTTRGLVAEFGRERVIDTPISEAAFLGAAAGLALSGYRPWVEIMFPIFFGVCLDQVITSVAQRYALMGQQCHVPLTIKTLINEHGVLYSMLAHVPGLAVVAPSSAYTAKGLTISALRYDGPVVIFDNIHLLRSEGMVPPDTYTVPIGCASIAREGGDVTLIGISAMTNVCLEAATALSIRGVDAEVVDLLSLSPIDMGTILKSVRKTRRLIVVDEGYPRCSVARDVIAAVCENGHELLSCSPVEVVPPQQFMPHAPALAAAYRPSVERVVEAAYSMTTARRAAETGRVG